MDEYKKRVEPKKIKMPPLVDRSMWYDTMSWCEAETKQKINNENNQQDNSESIQQLESDSTN